MYQDLRRQYYWSGMKQHVGDLFDNVSRVSKSRLRDTSSIRGNILEVGARHDGLCYPLATDTAET